VKDMTAKKDNDIDLLRQIYGEMTEPGKEKLKEVFNQILNIWKTVNEDKPENERLENEL
jgi:hypothetical protein